MKLEVPELSEQQEVGIGIGISVVAVAIFTYFAILYELNIGDSFSIFKQQIEISADLLAGDNFVAFATTVTFAFELLPHTIQVIRFDTIGVRLLQTGFNPWILAGIISFGKLSGQMILYTIGWYIAKIHGREFKMMEIIGDWFHKWHFFVFLFPPWLGMIGDGIMLGAGHQGISPIRIIPILYATNYGETLRWIVPTMGQLELSDSIQG